MTSKSNPVPFFVLVAMVSCAISHAVPQTAADDLRELEQRIARAWVQGDQAAIDAVLAADWTTIDIAGRLRSKDEVFRDMFGLQSPSIEEMVIDDVNVRLLGDVAVITGRTTAVGGDGTTVRLRFTDVAVHRNGRWQVVTSQGTQIAE